MTSESSPSLSQHAPTNLNNSSASISTHEMENLTISDQIIRNPIELVCETLRYSFESPSMSQFEEIRPTFQRFMKNYESEFEKMSSFFCTPFLIDQQLYIVVGARKSSDLNLPRNFEGTGVYLCENIVLQASPLDEIYSEKLVPGLDIGTDENDESSGTLGGIFKIQNENGTIG